MIKTIWRHPKIPKTKNERKRILHVNLLTHFTPKNNE